ncbi:NYN domain-containing protein [Dehalococcoidia bacterium]|nr:NYN domain-containing protein [Dehalococcoidia bacterium]
MSDQQIAVLIDYENVGLGSIQWLFDQISDIGRVVVKRAYGDWSTANSKKDRDKLLELGIEPIHLFHSVGSGKNSSDILLAIDAVELQLQSSVDTFVIVSADSDFAPLISRLRATGKMVIGAGRQAAVATTLVKSCDRYFYLDHVGDREDIQDVEPTKRRRFPWSRQGDSLLARAVKSAMDEQGRAPGSKLLQTMQRLDPAFDFRALGYPTFSKYLEASTEAKVTRPRGRGDVTVELVGS